MVDHVWTVLCLDFVTDNESNNMTLINTLEQVSIVAAPETKAQTPDRIDVRMALATLWTRADPTKGASTESRVTLKSPSGNTLWSKEYPVNLKTYSRKRQRIWFPNIGFAGFGRYRFIVHKKTPSGRWTKVASVPLEVLQSESAAAVSKAH